jgi:hypothetical protein
MKKIIVGLLLVSTFFSCSNSNNSTKKPSETFPKKDVIVLGEDEGWGADMKLSITEILKNDDNVTYTVNSTYDKKDIGFKISIPVGNAKSLTIYNTGSNSNHFIQTLSKLYKQQVDTSIHFVSSKQVAFIDLHQFANQLMGKETENSGGQKDLKMFFESENPDDYAEFYLNINETEHWVEFKEKEDSYRKQVLKGLTTK